MDTTGSRATKRTLFMNRFAYDFKSKRYPHPKKRELNTKETQQQIMQLILLNTSPKFLTHHSFPQLPTITKNRNHLPIIHTHIVRAGSESGFLTAIGRAIEEEEYRKARAEVNRKGSDLGGKYSIEGLSIGGKETCIIIPELKSAFDIGRCPSRAVQQNFLFITHAHLDHIGGLPMYVATRGLYNLKPPTVFVPSSIKEDVERLMDIHRDMGQVELDLDLIALDAGETYEMRNDLVVRPFKTHHVVPSQGYVVYSVRKKLRKQYMHLKGKQIEKLKKSGVEIIDTILCPELAFTGDTTSQFFLDPRSADALRAKILITEATFLDENVSAEHARAHGHTHLSEILDHAQWIRNETIVLTHFSPRYHIEDIRQAIVKLQSKVSAKVTGLTEGFKSMYS